MGYSLIIYKEIKIMTHKTKIAILMGGQSAEHEVSLLSAKNVLAGLQVAQNAERYELLAIGIHKEGSWYLQNLEDAFLNPHDPKTIALKPSSQKVTLVPGAGKNSLVVEGKPLSVDVVFPVLHGTYGEDGTLQGLLRMLDLPFVGADVLGTAVGMDKDVMKRLFREAQIPTADFLIFDSLSLALESYGECLKKLGDVIFVKPANAGSSVGVHKVKSKEDWNQAIHDAFLYDSKIIVEEFIQGREIECSVMGNEHLVASLPGEIVCHHEFYSYEAKYLDPQGADVALPANLPPEVVTRVQEIAKKTMRALCCEGLARVDVFVTDSGEVYVNEINTLPGFTNISMYPKMWEVSGLPQTELLHQLIVLALERKKRQKELKTHFSLK